MKKYIAVDLGASSGRVLVGNLESFEIVRRFESKKIFKGKSIYWDIEYIFQEICSGIKIALQKYPGDIVSIGIDTWGVDYCLLDENNHLLSLPFCYRDPRTEISQSEVHSVMSAYDLHMNTGIQIIQFNTIYQLKDDMMNRSEILDQAHSLLSIPDYLNFLLCGAKYSELTQASTTALIHPDTHDWNWSLIDTFGIPSGLFQPVIEPGTVLGTLNADLFGNENSAVKVTAVGSHDTASAVAAVPVQDKSENLFLSSGTWSLLGIESETPVISEFTYDNNFTNEISVDGGIRLIKNIMGMWLLQELKKGLDSGSGSLNWDELSLEARESKQPVLTLDPNDPLFFAPHTDENSMVERIQLWYKNQSLDAPGTRGELVRAVFDGLARTYSDYIKSFEIQAGKSFDSMFIVGGGSQDHYLCQLTADYAQKKVVAGPKEATALGNLLLQQISHGEISSIREGRKILSQMDELSVYYPCI